MPSRGESSVSDYLTKQKPELRKIAEQLRSIVKKTTPKLVEEMKWGFPSYSGTENVCSIMVTRAWVDLSFFRGVDLDDPKGLLEGSGKIMRHIKIHKLEDIDVSSIAGLVRQASELKPK